jgi:hypothetical protein
VLRKKTGWAHRASFEEIMSVLSVGAAKGEYDDLRAASGAVMSGQMGAFGSGWVGLLAGGDPSSLLAEPPAAQPLQPPDPRFVDGRTGTVQHRAVLQLRRLHDARRTSAAATPATPSAPTPIPMTRPRHRYTAAGAIAAMTYEGHGGVADFVADSLPHPALEAAATGTLPSPPLSSAPSSSSSYVTIGTPAAAPTAAAPTAAAPTAATPVTSSLMGLEATLLTRTGALRIVPAQPPSAPAAPPPRQPHQPPSAPAAPPPRQPHHPPRAAPASS